MTNNVWDEITYPFPNFNGTAVEVWEWISNFILLTFYNGCNYLSMLSLKSIYVSKGPLAAAIAVSSHAAHLCAVAVAKVLHSNQSWWLLLAALFVLPRARHVPRGLVISKGGATATPRAHLTVLTQGIMMLIQPIVFPTCVFGRWHIYYALSLANVRCPLRQSAQYWFYHRAIS